MKRVIRRAFVGLLAWLCCLAMSPSAWACAVCFSNVGDQSPLARGAQKGIIVMLIVTYAVVIGLIAMFAFQIMRARRRRSVTSGCSTSRHAPICSSQTRPAEPVAASQVM